MGLKEVDSGEDREISKWSFVVDLGGAPSPVSLASGRSHALPVCTRAASSALYPPQEAREKMERPEGTMQRARNGTGPGLQPGRLRGCAHLGLEARPGLAGQQDGCRDTRPVRRSVPRPSWRAKHLRGTRLLVSPPPWVCNLPSPMDLRRFSSGSGPTVASRP